MPSFVFDERLMQASDAEYFDLLLSLGWSEEEAERYVAWLFS